MSWAKVDDKFFAHPKVTRVSFGARGLWVTALSWCASLETDGFIPLDTLSVFASTESQQSYAALADELVRTGLWIEACTGGVRGYQVHDYEVYNPSRKFLIAQRKREAARLRAYRKRTSVRVETVRVSRPDPTRPDPAQRDLSLATQARPCATPEELLRVWNAHCGLLPKARGLSPLRRRHATVRLRERALGEWDAIVERVAASPFCRGERGSGWRATFDWLIEAPDSALKVLEGKYDEHQGPTITEILADAEARIHGGGAP